MREIKFRAWNGSEKRMTTPFAWMNDSNLLSSFMCSAPTERLMQFTGLKDCNGVDIYEGDVVTSHHFYDFHRKEHFLYHTVEWSDKYSGWYLRNINCGVSEDGCVQLWVGFKSAEFKVVGNIHQNPWLLGA